MDAWHQFVRRLGRSADHGDAVREASSLESIVALPTIGMDRRTRHDRLAGEGHQHRRRCLLDAPHADVPDGAAALLRRDHDQLLAVLSFRRNLAALNFQACCVLSR